MTEKTDRYWIWNLAVLGVVWLVGMASRLYYATHANLYIDEFTTIWAAQRVLSYGLPRFPTGAIYTQGLLHTYLEAGALLLGGGFHPLVARFPSLALAAVTLALTVYAARVLFRTLPVGLAALWLALDGEAILWGGRARTYALLQPLVLIAFLAWYAGAVADDRPRPRWLAIGLLLVALVDQPVTLLLFPPLAILAIVARGWGWLRQPVVWLQAGVIILGIAARWLIYQLMILPGTTATAVPRAFVDLIHPFAEWGTLAPFFTDPNRLLAALLLAGGVAWLLLRWRSGMPTWGAPVRSIAFVLAFVTLEMLLAVGTTWRRPRYLYSLLPLLFLGAEGVTVPALRWLAERLSFLPFCRALVGLAVASALLIVGLAWPSTRAAAMRNEWGYDRALAVVGDAWAEGDALATFAPAAAFVILDHGDGTAVAYEAAAGDDPTVTFYLAAEEGAQVLVVERDGQSLDSWTGLPLLDSPARLVEAVEAHPRLWFVVDEMRLDRHFSPEYLHLLWDRFDLVAFEWGTFVFRSRPADAPPSVDRSLDADFAGQLRLVGYALSDDRPEPGQIVTVILRWAPVVPEGKYIASVRLVNQAGETVALHDEQPLGGLYPADRWHWSPRSHPFPDRHPLALPNDLPSGRYRLDVALNRPRTGEPVGERLTLDFLTVGGDGDAVEPPLHAPVARFGDAVTLLSHDLIGGPTPVSEHALVREVAPGSTVTLRLLWQTGLDGFDADYNVFIHLVDASGQIAQQWDAPPAGGSYPTSHWDPGEIVLDDHDLAFSPQLAPGAYRLVAGLYRLLGTAGDSTRLPLDDGSDLIEVAVVDLRH